MTLLLVLLAVVTFACRNLRASLSAEFGSITEPVDDPEPNGCELRQG